MTAPANSVTRAVFRLPRSAYLAVLFLIFCVTPLVRTPLAALIYLVPLAVALFVARAGTVVDERAVTVRALISSRTLPWSQIESFAADRRGRVSAVVDAEGRRRAWRLPFVRARHLPMLKALGGRESPASDQ